MKKVIIFFWQIIKRPKLLLLHNKIPLNTRIDNGAKLKNSTIGKYCYVCRGTQINNCRIGNYCSIAPGVQIGGMEHPYWDLSTSTHLSNQYVFGKETLIGNDVWIAAGAIIKQGITIGNGAVIGANSFINKDVEPYAIMVGSPGKMLKYRFNAEIINQLKESEYWKFKPVKAKEILADITMQ